MLVSRFIVLFWVTRDLLSPSGTFCFSSSLFEQSAPSFFQLPFSFTAILAGSWQTCDWRVFCETEALPLDLFAYTRATEGNRSSLSSTSCLCCGQFCSLQIG